MTFEIEIISEEGREDYEIWTCKNCGRFVMTSVGADMSCCPCEFENEGEAK
jgi:hypothetical protein